MNKNEYFNLICIFKELEDTSVEFDSSMVTFSNKENHIHITHNHEKDEVDADKLKNFILETYKKNLVNLDFKIYKNYKELLDSGYVDPCPIQNDDNNSNFYFREGKTIRVGKDFWDKRKSLLKHIGFKDIK